MLKKILVGVVLSAGLMLNASADELKSDMYIMAGDLSSLQMSLLSNNKKATMSDLLKLQGAVEKYLGNEKTIVALLPERFKKKSKIALNSSEMIHKNIASIQSAYSDTAIKDIVREMEIQKAFANIQYQCFRCHNLVRDWK